MEYRPLFAYLLACLIGVTLILALRRLKILSQDKLSIFLTNQRLSLWAAVVLVAIALLYLLLNTDLRNFIVGSLEITKGYSQSMGTVGSQSELSAGVFITFGIVVLAAVVVWCDVRNLCVALPVLLWTLMSFKHGFIRHDWAHVPLFAIAAPAYLCSLGALIPAQVRNKKTKYAQLIWALLVACAIALFLGFGMKTSAFNRSKEARYFYLCSRKCDACGSTTSYDLGECS